MFCLQKFLQAREDFDYTFCSICSSVQAEFQDSIEMAKAQYDLIDGEGSCASS